MHRLLIAALLLAAPLAYAQQSDCQRLVDIAQEAFDAKVKGVPFSRFLKKYKGQGAEVEQAVEWGYMYDSALDARNLVRSGCQINNARARMGMPRY